jgi:2-keto-4-pentenoate hydratase
VEPLLRSSLERQLRDRRAELDAGAERVGWKLGVGERERIGPGPVIGYLTSATQLEPGATFAAEGVGALHADAEVALEIGPDGISGFGAALELCDLASPPDNPHEVVAANVFHRAFALGPLDRPPPGAGAQGRLVVNGDVRASAPLARDFDALVTTVGDLLGELGERLQPGDRLITGSVVQVPLEGGDRVVADLGPLGSVELATR